MIQLKKFTEKPKRKKKKKEKEIEKSETNNKNEIMQITMKNNSYITVKKNLFS